LAHHVPEDHGTWYGVAKAEGRDEREELALGNRGNVSMRYEGEAEKIFR
jgi:hypothetical protein